jgi:Tol biopolymer transport system component
VVPFMIANTDRARPPRIAFHRMGGGGRQSLVDGAHPILTATGQLVLARDGVLWSAPFDVDSGTLTAEPAPVVTGVQQLNAVAQAAVAGHTLVYAPGGVVAADAVASLSLVLVDAAGREERVTLDDRPYAFPRLSPDGQRIAVRVQGPGRGLGDLWVYDLRTGAGLRLTHQGDNRLPIWSPDGRFIFYTSADPAAPSAVNNVFRVAADGSGQPQRITNGDRSESLTGISPDGKMVLFTRTMGPGQWEIVGAPASGAGPPTPILTGRFRRGSGELSPDGKWLLYRSDDGGSFEIYLQPYPGPGPKLPVSVGGGDSPIWSHDGRTIYYRDERKVMAVDVRTQPTLQVSRPRMLFEGTYVTGFDTGRHYHVAPDGRLLMLKAGVALERQRSERAGDFVVLLDWQDEVRRASRPGNASQ